MPSPPLIVYIIDVRLNAQWETHGCYLVNITNMPNHIIFIISRHVEIVPHGEMERKCFFRVIG